MKSLFQDLRYSLRQLKESPGFSMTAVVSLSLGIAATTAVFSSRLRPAARLPSAGATSSMPEMESPEANSSV
jgi:hypothetical protein